jgi:preprotein translocase SecE subunit
MSNQEVAESKPVGFFERVLGGIRKPIRETLGELRRVHWPTRLDVRNLSVIILVVTAIMAALLGLADFLVDRLFTGLLRAQPDVIAVAFGIAIVLALLVMVWWISRDRR